MMNSIYFNIKYTKEFEKELKKLSKKYRTLKSDLQNFIKTQVKIFYIDNIDNRGVFRIAGLGIEEPKIYKSKKFACKSLKGTHSKSGIRIIYAHYKQTKTIEFIEIYYIGDKKNEDRDRIKRYYSE